MSLEIAPSLRARFLHYDALLRQWQKSLNLVGPSTLEESWKRHFLDSAQIRPLLQKSLPRVVDVGSGAGFPGMVLAMMLKGDFHLVESDQRKCEFLREVARVLDVSVTIHPIRVERVVLDTIDYIVSRACAPVSQFIEITEKLVSYGTEIVLAKGKNHRIEIEAAKEEGWQFDIDIHSSITDPYAAILRLCRVSRREDAPRRAPKNQLPTNHENRCYCQSKGWCGENNDDG